MSSRLRNTVIGCLFLLAFEWAIWLFIAPYTLIPTVKVFYIFLFICSCISLVYLLRSAQKFALFKSKWIYLAFPVFIINAILKISAFLVVGIFVLLNRVVYLLLGIPNIISDLTISYILLSILVLLLLIVLYGLTIGRYLAQVNKVNMVYNSLPKEFDGFKIVQISDIHCGGIFDRKAFRHMLKTISKLNADVVLFTGDMVNDHYDEMIPFIQDLENIKAKAGKFAVLGNHDYYALYSMDKDQRSSYWEQFADIYARSGFKLLNNESVTLRRAEQQLYIVGVENWGRGSYFPKYGDIDKALLKVPEDGFVILMSHDPSHWEELIEAHPRHIDLTLSGHTHGFQFGFRFGSFVWSPIQKRYKYWQGLYSEGEQYLHVNVGLGYLMIPFRIGMQSEITEITLKTK